MEESAPPLTDAQVVELLVNLEPHAERITRSVESIARYVADGGRDRQTWARMVGELTRQALSLTKASAGAAGALERVVSARRSLLDALREYRAKIASGRLTLDEAAHALACERDRELTIEGARDYLNQSVAEVGDANTRALKRALEAISLIEQGRASEIPFPFPDALPDPEQG